MRVEQHEMPDKPFEDGGELEILLRSHDWSQTPLGAVETWSESFKTAVQSRLTELNQAQSPEPVQQASVLSQNCTPIATRRQAVQADGFRVTLFDALRSLTDANEIQATAARMLGEHLGVSRVVYAEVLPDGKNVIVHKNYTNGVAELSGLYRLEDFGRNLIDDHRAGKTAIIPDVANSLKYTDSEKAMYRDIDIAAHLDVPLIKNDRFIALLAVHQVTPRAWTEREVKWVEETAEQTWATVERARAEAALRESEAKYRTLFESIDAGFCIIEVLFDAEGKPFDHCVLHVNPAIERQTGVVNPEGKRASELVPGEQYWNDLYAQVINTGESIRTEVRADALDRWFDVSVSRIGDAARRQVAVVFNDISERKRAEAALRESETRLRFMLDASQIGDWDLDLTTQPHTAHRSLRHDQILGYESLLPEWSYEIFLAHVHPDDRADVDERFQKTLSTGTNWNFECRVIHPDQSIHWIWVRSSVYWDSNGTPTRLLGMVVDITDRKQTEAVLQESEELKRRILESSKDCIKVLTLEGRFLYLSTGGFHLLEIDDPTSILDAQWLDFWQGEDYQSAKAALAAAKSGDVGQFQGYAPTAKGNLRWWDVIVTPIQDASGRVAQLLSISRDITKQKQAELEREQLLTRERAAREDAERANRIKDEFLAVLSHELRSPLNPILGWTQLLRKGKLNPARQMDALATIERNAKLQSQLIEDLLDISRIMQGKLTLTATSVSLAFIISAAAETVSLAAAAKNIQITLDLDSDVAPVSGDAARLQQVVWNLLTNAVKFTDNGGQVTVQLRRVATEGSLDNAMAQIRVIDTGKGINPQLLPHVFESFWQEDGSTTRKFGGLGLGLAIVRQIVESHGGTVSVESDGEHQGATLIVQLPALQQATPVRLEQNQLKSASETRLNNVQVLLVEDDTDTREFQSFLLEQHGATVTAVASGVEALQALEQWLPDVIVSDIGMAEMDGYRLMQQLRSRPPTQGGTVPAIALTAYAAEIDQKKALQAGFQTHLTKPLEPERFVNKIVALLKPGRV